MFSFTRLSALPTVSVTRLIPQVTRLAFRPVARMLNVPSFSKATMTLPRISLVVPRTPASIVKVAAEPVARFVAAPLVVRASAVVVVGATTSLTFGFNAQPAVQCSPAYGTANTYGSTPPRPRDEPRPLGFWGKIWVFMQYAMIAVVMLPIAYIFSVINFVPRVLEGLIFMVILYYVAAFVQANADTGHKKRQPNNQQQYGRAY